MSFPNAGPDKRQVLTDDEALAISASGGAMWPAPLPTVDVDSADEVTRAVARGIRSLAVRGLTADGLPDVQALYPAAALLGAAAALRAFMSVDGDAPAPGASVTTLTILEAGMIAVLVTSDTGVHVVSEMSIADARELILKVARDVYTSLTDTIPNLALCLVKPAERALLIGPGSAQMQQLSLAGVSSNQLPGEWTAAAAEFIADALADPTVAAALV